MIVRAVVDLGSGPVATATTGVAYTLVTHSGTTSGGIQLIRAAAEIRKTQTAAEELRKGRPAALKVVRAGHTTHINTQSGVTTYTGFRPDSVRRSQGPRPYQSAVITIPSQLRY
jgi:hypothetical protein